MLAFLFLMLLFFFLAGFLSVSLGIDLRLLGSEPLFATITSTTGISSETIQVLFGTGVIFSEFVIVLLTMLDRIGNTLRDSVKPLVRLVPFFIFIRSIWTAFVPVIAALLPGLAETFGLAESQATLTASVQSGQFTETVLLSLGAMLLFVIATYALGRPAESAELKALRAENAKLKKELRRGL